jgi:hypothetical protein
MAYFAVLDQNDIVTGVYGSPNDQNNDSGSGSEESEKAIIGEASGVSDMSKIVKTSKDKSFRGAFAGIGLLYDRERDVFLIPKRHPSWVYDESIKSYVPPVSMPDDGGDYAWDEENIKWIPIGDPETGATLFQL